MLCSCVMGGKRRQQFTLISWFLPMDFFFSFFFLFSLGRPLTFPHKNIPPMKRKLAWSNILQCAMSQKQQCMWCMEEDWVKCSFTRLTQQLFLHLTQKREGTFFSLFEHVVATFCFTHKRERTMRMGASIWWGKFSLHKWGSSFALFVWFF